MRYRYPPNDNVSEIGFSTYDAHHRRVGWLVFAAIVAFNIGMAVGLSIAYGSNEKKIRPFGPWHRSYVTTYSWTEGGSHQQGCQQYWNVPLQNWHRTFAARDYQVPCGGKAVFCYKRRCVVGRRTDSSGGGVAGDSLDLNYGLARALRLPSGAVVSADGSYPGGYTWVSWRRVR